MPLCWVERSANAAHVRQVRAASISTSSVPCWASRRIMSPLRILAIAAGHRFGRYVDRCGHAAARAGHASVGEQCDAMAAILQHASGGVSLCSSGMPFACGPWKRTTAMKSRLSSPRLNAALDFILIVEHDGRRLDEQTVVRYGRHLDHGAAEIAMQHAQAAVGAERFVHTAQHAAIAAFLRYRRPDAACRRRHRAREPSRVGIAVHAVPKMCVHRHAAGRRSTTDRSGTPCRRLHGTGSRRRSRSDRRAPAAGSRRQRVEIVPAQRCRPPVQSRPDAAGDWSSHRSRASRSRR
jgi:hypothetical protein